jgi:hypothetical protein
MPRELPPDRTMRGTGMKKIKRLIVAVVGVTLLLGVAAPAQAAWPIHENPIGLCTQGQGYISPQVTNFRLGNKVGGPYVRRQYVYYRTYLQAWSGSAWQAVNNTASGWYWGITNRYGTRMQLLQGTAGTYLDPLTGILTQNGVYWDRVVNGQRTTQRAPFETTFVLNPGRSVRMVYQYKWPGYGSAGWASRYKYYADISGNTYNFCTV